MISNQNPVEFLRKLINQIKGIEKIDEWKAYIGIAFLSMSISLLFMMYSVFNNNSQVLVSSKNQHITLSLENIIEKPVIKPIKTQGNNIKKVENIDTNKTIDEKKPNIENGDWYYDDVHKDWRYKKNK